MSPTGTCAGGSRARPVGHKRSSGYASKRSLGVRRSTWVSFPGPETRHQHLRRTPCTVVPSSPLPPGPPLPRQSAPRDPVSARATCAVSTPSTPRSSPRIRRSAGLAASRTTPSNWRCASSRRWPEGQPRPRGYGPGCTPSPRTSCAPRLSPRSTPRPVPALADTWTLPSHSPGFPATARPSITSGTTSRWWLTNEATTRRGLPQPTRPRAFPSRRRTPVRFSGAHARCSRTCGRR